MCAASDCQQEEGDGEGEEEDLKGDIDGQGCNEEDEGQDACRKMWFWIDRKGTPAYEGQGVERSVT